MCARRILELGSGTGILGMALHKLVPDASVVALTDGDSQALDLLQRNLEEPTNHMDPRRVKAKLLQWGVDHHPGLDTTNRSINHNDDDDDDDDDAETSDNTLKSFQQWARASWPHVFASDPRHFDWIVAGDVLYKAQLPQLFFETVRALLRPGTGTLLLCHVPRAAVTQAVVQEAAHSAGMDVVSSYEPNHHTRIMDVAAHHCPIEDVSRACIYRMQRNTRDE